LKCFVKIEFYFCFNICFVKHKNFLPNIEIDFENKRKLLSKIDFFWLKIEIPNKIEIFVQNQNFFSKMEAFL